MRDHMNDMNMTNGMNPAEMTGDQRVAEVSMLLALGMMRLWEKQRGHARPARVDERVISRDFGGYSLGSAKESRPTVTVGNDKEQSQWN